MTPVFFNFLLLASLGLLVALPLVPDVAGVKFFKFCSGTSAFMLAAALGLAYRRYGLAAHPPALGGADYGTVMALMLATFVATVLYNRARHFGWHQAQAPFLAAAIVLGLGVAALAASRTEMPLWAVSALSAIVLLGGAVGAMILGHFYLVVLDLPISALRRLTLMLIAGIVLRTLVVGFVLLGPAHAGFESAHQVAIGLWDPDGVFIWMRILFGIAGPLCLVWFIWKTVEIRSTQSATGILYVQLFLVMSGELLAQYLRVVAGLPL
jgi:protein NrfD